MKSDRRTFLLVAGAAAIAGPAVQLAKGQGKAKVFLPHASWDCGMMDGIPNPESGSLIFETQLKLDRLAKIGKTQYGNRRVAVALEGTTTGPKFTGTVMTGALDFELTLSNGTVEVEQIFVFKTGDGKYIYSRNAGVGADARDVRMAMDFEAPNGSSAEWMNSGKYVAQRILDENAKTLTVRVYDVSSVTIPTGGANITRIVKPSGSAAAVE